MTDNLHIPQRLENEYEYALGSTSLKTGATAPSPVVDLSETGISTVDQVSMEALLNVLIKRGLCTENELMAEEHRLRALRETVTRIKFSPVQIHREGDEYRTHHHHHHHLIRRWAAKHQWSRRLGTVLFGWKWHRRKKEQQL